MTTPTATSCPAAWAPRSRPSSPSSKANPHGQALITKPETIVDALDGKTGTWFSAQ